MIDLTCDEAVSLPRGWTWLTARHAVRTAIGPYGLRLTRISFGDAWHFVLRSPLVDPILLTDQPWPDACGAARTLMEAVVQQRAE